MQELYKLTGQKILIIGGGSRMGLAVARLVSNLGAEVIISSRSTEKLEQAAATISAQVGIYTADATDALATGQMLKALAPIDHIVVTASGSSPATGIVDTPPNIARIAFSRFWLSYNVLHYAPSQVRPSGSISSGRFPAACCARRHSVRRVLLSGIEPRSVRVERSDTPSACGGDVHSHFYPAVVVDDL